MKSLVLFVLTAALATAESHPSWWAYASPEATALVGIHWDNLRTSPFAAAIAAELASTGPLAFPDLDCLRQAREIVISSPELLAMEAGNFPASVVQDQAERAGLHRVVYRSLTLWTPSKAASLGVAQISEQLVLVGTRKTLQSAIDQSMLETGRLYSALLPRAAHFSQTGDLWVVALKLPDPLASLFVPLDAEAWEFMGQVSVRDGLTVEASFDAGSEDAAAQVAADLREQATSFSPVARGLEATANQSTVTMELQVNRDDLAAALHPPPPAPYAVAKLTAPAPAPIVTKPAKPKPAEPQIVHIIGLDGGPRDIRLPPVPSDSAQ